MARLKLEPFEKQEIFSEQISFEPLELEEVKLASFEQGYSAGWEDAVAAQNAETTRLRGDLGNNLRQISLSYEEARRHILEALEPLLSDVLAKVMPKVAQDTLPHIVSEHLKPFFATIAAAPVTITCSPVALPQIRDLLDNHSSLPLQFIAEPSLSERQVYLSTDKIEQRIDLDGVIQAISAAIAAYYRIEISEHGNG
jgi:flagellar assembly protein FliH